MNDRKVMSGTDRAVTAAWEFDTKRFGVKRMPPGYWGLLGKFTLMSRKLPFQAFDNARMHLADA